MQEVTSEAIAANMLCHYHNISKDERQALPPGTPGSALLRLHFFSSREDAEAMEHALEDCERIEEDEY